MTFGAQVLAGAGGLVDDLQDHLVAVQLKLAGFMGSQVVVLQELHSALQRLGQDGQVAFFMDIARNHNFALLMRKLLHRGHAAIHFEGNTSDKLGALAAEEQDCGDYAPCVL